MSSAGKDYSSDQKELKKAEQRFRFLSDNIADVLWTVDIAAPAKLTYVSPSITRLLGYSVVEALAKPMTEVFTAASLGIMGKSLAENIGVSNLATDSRTATMTLELEFIHKNGSVVPVEVKYNYLPGPDGRLAEILAVARDITDRRKAEEAARVCNQKLMKAMEHTLQAIARIMEIRDPHSVGHQHRVSQLAAAIAEDMGLPPDTVTAVRLAGLIHDVGKIKAALETTGAGGAGTSNSDALKAHPRIGYEILKSIEFPWPIAEIVKQHHERIDGSGYPEGLKDGQIIIEARILAVADVVESLAFYRPYRAEHGTDKALEKIASGRGELYDAAVVDSCLRLFNKRGFQFPIEASDFPQHKRTPPASSVF